MGEPKLWRRIAFGCAILAGLASTGSAQFSANEASVGNSDGRGFIARFGDGWRVVRQPVTGAPAFVYGSRLQTPFLPASAEDYVQAARWIVDEAPDLFGVDSGSLQLVQSKRVPLVGTSPKWSVVFDQVVGGMAVLNGRLSVLFDEASGDILALDFTGIPDAQQLDLVPALSDEAALAIASSAYAAEFGAEALQLDGIELYLVGPQPYFGLKGVLTEIGPTLAYHVELSSPGMTDTRGLPISGRVFVSAGPDGSVLKVESRVHTCTSVANITGTVNGNVNTGNEPNTGSNQENPGLENLWVRQNNSGGAVLATTDSNGDFVIGQNGPITLYFALQGPFFNVVNIAGAEASFSTLADMTTPVGIQFNPTLAESTTAEVAGAYWVNDFRNFVVTTDPGDTNMDFSVLTNVNLASTCNAYYDGSSINMYSSGGGCPNTAFRSVIQHEEGHWANNVYNGFVSGAFHEGVADAWSAYIANDPCLGPDFLGPGAGCLRDGEQTSIQKCAGDCDESCHGGAVHTEGQAIASALWKTRRNLNNAFGAMGGQIASGLFLGWMQTYNDTSICNNILDHWVALDDDNGNLSDGTPHLTEINGGFTEQNWPAFVIPDVAITNVAGPAAAASVSHLQPVKVTATITSALGSINSASVRYSTNDGASYASVAMNPTAIPNQYSAKIPGVVSPETVRWYIEAGSTAGNSASEPANAPAGYHFYYCGTLTTFASYNFEGGSDQGWTHVCLAGGSACDQWERANPAGSNASTDPTAAFSGTNVWGTDLSTTGNDGMYEPNTSSELRSPTFDLSAATSVLLSFQRYLAVEEAIYDQAEVRVNGTVIWSNPLNGHTLDSSWTQQTFDITALAAGNPSVQIAFRISSDGGLEFGGWNIDDFALTSLQASPPGTFTQYGAGCPGTGGNIPNLTGSGTPVPCGAVTINVSSARPNSVGFLFTSATSGSSPFGPQCTLLLGLPLSIAIGLPVNGAGNVSVGGTVPDIGMTDYHVYMQWLALDNGAPVGKYATSNGLDMHVR